VSSSGTAANAGIWTSSDGFWEGRDCDISDRRISVREFSCDSVSAFREKTVAAPGIIPCLHACRSPGSVPGPQISAARLILFTVNRQE
jgi:hypothetical protein